MTCKSCWHIIWRLPYKKDVFKIIQKFCWTQHGICYINMTMFLHWFFFLCETRTDHLWEQSHSLLASCAIHTTVCWEPTSPVWSRRGHLQASRLLCGFISWPVIPFIRFPRPPISNHFLCFSYYIAHSGHVATEREETHIGVDSAGLVMSINSAGDFSRSRT